MTDLKKEELLDIFEGVFSFYLGELGHEEDKVKIEQAKKQIKEMIQKPEVTEEFVEKWVETIGNHTCGPGADKPLFITMLKEAGVHVPCTR